MLTETEIETETAIVRARVGIEMVAEMETVAVNLHRQ